MTNTALATRTLDFIHAHPELHDQGTWAYGPFIPTMRVATEADLFADPAAVAPCGTAACFAGWAAVLGGWHQLRGPESDMVVDETGRVLHMKEAAIESLGVRLDQADALFNATIPVELIDLMVAHLVADPDVDLTRYAPSDDHW